MTREDIEREKRIAHARNMRFKRPALSILGYEDMMSELSEIDDDCCNAANLLETDKDGLLDAFSGDEEEAFEFDMVLQDICFRMYQLREQIEEAGRYDDKFGRTFNDCIVGLIGNRYKLVGYDEYEEDYFSLTSYEADIALSEVGKRLCRMTKPELLATIGQCMGIALAYLDIRHDYNTMKASFDIVRDHNSGVIEAVREIENLYDKITSHTAGAADRDRFQNLCDTMPDRVWLE